ncbi:MAG: L,D-transpeptidase family protein [Rhodobacteraceae bacterium]|nr:L,D-transpeptidase family protein [Paracoccaceae bacterium]MCW9043364.1 L,D-transpeptidase family protein [Pseudopelagicola sp.]
MTPDDLVLTPRGIRYCGRIFPCTIGKDGLTSDKREGDGATPRGIHRITGLLYRADRLAAPAPWAMAIGKDDLWSDAPDDPAYNTLVHAPYGPSYEALRRADPLYDVILLTDWNWPASRPGKGSAIFLHQYRRKGYPTEGCIAFRRDHLLWIAARAAPGTRVIVP